jgi:DNA polymerase
MPRLYLDFETRSRVDLRKAGVYRYAADPSTHVMLAAWAVDNGPIRWSTLPPFAHQGDGDWLDLLNLLGEPDTIVVAHNAGFERLICREKLDLDIPLERWDCTAARCARQALPRDLERAAQALGLPVRKDRAGHSLMLQMCKPRRPRKDEDPNGIYWFEDQERIERLGAYCQTDVAVTRPMDKLLAPLPDREREIWRLTERMNDRGVMVDLTFANQARWIAHDLVDFFDRRISNLTGGAVPRTTNLAKLRAWLWENYGLEVLESEDEEMAKANLERIKALPETPDLVKAVIDCRLEAGKTSVQKFQAIIDRAQADSRVRGNLMYHGASPGRWAGTGVQMQNLPRKVVSDFPAVQEAAASLDGETFAARFPSPMTTLSQSLRRTIVAPKGKRLIWIDYASVEARGVAWLAGATRLVELFASGGKIYEEMAGTIFDVPASQVGKDSLERFVGKTAVLGCGYGMGAAKFQATCEAQGQIISLELAQRAVKAYRTENPEIPRLWRGLEDACKQAIRAPGRPTRYGMVSFMVEGPWLKMRLPNDRILWYRNPRLEEDTRSNWQGNEIIAFDAVNPKTKQWGRETTWGGTLTENAVQGLCRDLMADGLLRLEAAGFNPVLSVHDEAIVEAWDHRPELTLGNAKELLCTIPYWGRGFPLDGEGKEGVRYGK